MRYFLLITIFFLFSSCEKYTEEIDYWVGQPENSKTDSFHLELKNSVAFTCINYKCSYYGDNKKHSVIILYDTTINNVMISRVSGDKVRGTLITKDRKGYDFGEVESALYWSRQK